MDKKTTICFILALFLLGALVFSLGSSGISRSVVREARAEELRVREVAADIENRTAEVTNDLRAEPELFARRDLATVWPREIEEARGLLEEAREEVTTALTLLDTDDPEKVGAIQTHLDQARSLRDRAHRIVTEIHQTSRRWVSTKRDFSRKLDEARQTHEKIAGTSLQDLESSVARAVADWPEKKEFLEARITFLKETVERASKNWEAAKDLRTASPADLEPADFERMISLESSLKTDLESLVSGRRDLPGLIAELYVSWDKTLADMEIREGSTVTFYLTYVTVRTPVAPASTGEDGGQNSGPPVEPTKDSTQVKVNEKVYKSMEPHLGMVVEHKPAGKFDREAEKVIQPPGYAYMCPPEQKRNRYGYWEQRNGSNFWVFYGQYALMRELFWGNSYRGGWVSGDSYRDFSRSRRLGKPYYGKTDSGQSRFGKSGTFTRSRYQDSKYVKTGGFKNSQYVKSGGTYKGSRYSSRSSSYRSSSSSRSGSSRSSFSSRSRSRSFGGSRFGGGK